jgi:hypothetical protein
MGRVAQASTVGAGSLAGSTFLREERVKVIKRSRLFGNKTRVTFSLPLDAPVGTVSVVGCFNDWQPGHHELLPRRDGSRSVTINLNPGSYRFRYLATGGVWFDDAHADHVGPDGGHISL